MVVIQKEESILDIPEHRLTPGMKQYRDAKRDNPDCIIMLRMGDFYELFYEDAVTASKELEITLTARGKGEKKAPLAGIPYHALETYLGRLVKKGYKVAIIEQLEDPKKAKGLVKRGLVRIVTPGTVIDASLLNEKENNYVAAITIIDGTFALAFCDLSTGEFTTTTVPSETQLLYELSRFSPSECVVPDSLLVNQQMMTQIEEQCFVNSLEDYHFRQKEAAQTIVNHFRRSLDSFSLHDKPLHTSICGALLQYLIMTQKNSLSHITNIKTQSNRHMMLLDLSTVRNLELLQNIRDGSAKGTLLSILDRTVTPMGGRLLKRWIREPLVQQKEIEKRLNALEWLNENVIIREEIIQILDSIYDIERLIGRVNYGNANPKDLLALRNSLRQLPLLKEKLQTVDPLLQTIASCQDHHVVEQLLTKTIQEEPPLTLREGGIVKTGYREELDALQDIRRNSTQYLQKIEEEEKRKTGISSLKLRYTRVFGYFIEVTKKNLSLVPDHYIRKQTTANAERYITEELKVEEEKILTAAEKINQLEYDLFQEILKEISVHTQEMQETAQKVAVLDVITSLAKVSLEHNYVKPKFVPENVIQIRNGRHPVVEQLEPGFIKNDVLLQDGHMMIITGPNMSGKSTVMRQTALIVLLAQMGCFVPADEVVLGITDRIFTRVGASDDISSGQSTFMVEMNETASILHSATERSLIILDEIGRGTSTFDGVSIAWSVVEYIYNNIKAKTMFATHYHVMNKLADKFSRIVNYNVAVKEVGDEIILLHKLVQGGTNQSYGVHVAKLAGLPYEVIERAKELQQVLERDDDMMRRINAKKLEQQRGLTEFQ